MEHYVMFSLAFASGIVSIFCFITGLVVHIRIRFKAEEKFVLEQMFTTLLSVGFGFLSFATILSLAFILIETP